MLNYTVGSQAKIAADTGNRQREAAFFSAPLKSIASSSRRGHLPAAGDTPPAAHGTASHIQRGPRPNPLQIAAQPASWPASWHQALSQLRHPYQMTSDQRMRKNPPRRRPIARFFQSPSSSPPAAGQGLNLEQRFRQPPQRFVPDDRQRGTNRRPPSLQFWNKRAGSRIRTPAPCRTPICPAKSARQMRHSRGRYVMVLQAAPPCSLAKEEPQASPELVDSTSSRQEDSLWIELSPHHHQHSYHRGPSKTSQALRKSQSTCLPRPAGT
mmetsp:Transcript_15986/g.40569  ORF Transcript_15986/g.40569 Transcript_15986/m.40569 type:complete len:268 (-) Transcript_15986:26-829(-)